MRTKLKEAMGGGNLVMGGCAAHTLFHMCGTPDDFTANALHTHGGTRDEKFAVHSNGETNTCQDKLVSFVCAKIDPASLAAQAKINHGVSPFGEWLLRPSSSALDCVKLDM